VARVLVIEDEESVRSIIRRVLLERGHEVTEADTARSGLEAARSAQVDVVLGDVCLGGGDGIKVMADIRRAQPEMPLIAISGRIREEIVDELSAAGLLKSVWCLEKPFTHEDLIEAVRQALARS
jgi:CheY-like chemotaxis protein